MDNGLPLQGKTDKQMETDRAAISIPWSVRAIRNQMAAIYEALGTYAGKRYHS